MVGARRMIDFDAKIEEYNDKFKEAQDLQKGLGQAMVDFVTGYEPIRKALISDLKVIGGKHRAAIQHKDRRMAKVCATLLNLVHDRFYADGVIPPFSSFLEEFEDLIGVDTYAKIIESPRISFPIASDRMDMENSDDGH